MPSLASTPSPPYYAVVFTSVRTDVDGEGYARTAERMVQLATEQPGFLGVESARGSDGLGITVSYWDNLDAIRRWREHAEHRQAAPARDFGVLLEDPAEALGKALLAAGSGLPGRGAAVLLSIADRDKDEAMPLIRRLCELGYDLVATEGTAARIRLDLGLQVDEVTKKLNEGHPNVIDVIVSGRV